VPPSHAQADRVADGSIDLAICWMQTPDLAEHGLTARLIGADRLHAVAVGSDRSAVDAPDTVVLLDADTATASSDVPAGTVVTMSARNSIGVAPSDVRSNDTLTPPPGRGRARGDRLGHTHLAVNQYEQARTVWQEALTLYRITGHCLADRST
jgi:hypothetical protein